MAEVLKITGSETAAAERKRRSRATQKLLSYSNNVTVECDNVTKCHTEIEKELEIDKEIDKEVDNKSDKPTRTRFKPPSKEEVEAYCFERNNQVDAERFIDYYTANGWCVGKNKMKDWKAAVRTWEKNGYANAKTPKRSVGEEAYEFYEIGKQMQEEGEPF
jgi:hypothetical protein